MSLKPPADKAQELINKIGLKIGQFNRSRHILYQLSKAKELAIITCEECADACAEISKQNHGVNYIDYGQGYYLDVIKEIERL